MKDNWNKNWREFWKPLLLTKGKLDEKKVKNEMHDLVFIYDQVGEVYCHITGNKLSKPMYYADTIINEFETEVEVRARELNEQLSKEKEGL